MIEPAIALTLLQWGDSAFPAGGFAFSWGVEGLAADGLLAGAEDLGDLMAEHLRSRWATMDRVFLHQAYGADALAEVAALDRFVEASTPSAEMREGSRRAGRALLGTASRLGQPGATAYRAALAADARLGHLAVAQGVVYHDAGLPIEAAELLSGWTLVTGLASAALRLGLVGHIEAQQLLGRTRPLLAELTASPMPDEPSSFTPLGDIAVSRGSGRHLRLFAT